MAQLLYSCDADSGGIAEYAIRQVAALAEAGLEVTFLCRPSFPVERMRGCRVDAYLPNAPEGGPVWKKIADRISDGRRIAKVVADTALEPRVDAVLMACYSEYFSRSGLRCIVGWRIAAFRLAPSPMTRCGISCWVRYGGTVGA